MNLARSILFFSLQIVFSVIVPLLFIPIIGNRRVVRLAIAFFFGRLYGKRYDNIIDSFQGRYGLAMDEGLKHAKEIAGDGITVIADCGTGTGFVTRQAVEQFPDEIFVAFDLLSGMLKQARKNCLEIPNEIFHVQADSFELPLADESVDLVLAQNTMPCFKEYHRVCRPGGITIFVDSSSGWVTNLAKGLLKMHGLFESVKGERVDMGCWILARKAGSLKAPVQGVEGGTKQERLVRLLRCPLDKTELVVEEDSLCCAHQHRFPIEDGFPVMLRKKAIPSFRNKSC